MSDVVEDEAQNEFEESLPEPTLDDVCVQCRQGFHDECESFWSHIQDDLAWIQCCCSGTFELSLFFKQEANRSSLGGLEGYVDGAAAGKEPITAYFDGFTGIKDPSTYADPVSTGRKMAKLAAPITPGLVCEWAWLAKAGGGVLPIVGCPGRPASDRHHGPDKNTLHNELGVNLHRVCDWCHNQWHAKNDPHYGSRPANPDGTIDGSVPFVPLAGIPSLPHDPITRASDQEVYREDAERREEARKHGAKI